MYKQGNRDMLYLFLLSEPNHQKTREEQRLHAHNLPRQQNGEERGTFQFSVTYISPELDKIFAELNQRTGDSSEWL